MAIVMAAIILGADPGGFLDPASVLIVIGGSVFVVLSKLDRKSTRLNSSH